MLGGGVLLFTGFGTAYAIPIFFPVLSAALAIPLPHLTRLFSTTGALYFSLGIVSGPLADRIGARVIAAVGCAVLACGLVAMSWAGGERAFEAGYLLGVGGGVGLCFVPTVGAVQALCQKNPAIAGSIVASGIGIGTLVLPPLAQLMIVHVGWRQGLRVLGILAACGGLAALPLVMPGAANDRSGVAVSSIRAPRLAELLRSDRFLLLYAAQLLISAVAFVPFAHLIFFAEAMGWSAATGGYLIGLIGIGSIGGRLLLGIVAQSLGACRVAGLCAVVMALALALLPAATNCWELGGDVALYGLGYGGVIGLTGPVVAEVMGVRGICASVGLVTTSRAMGILVGPWTVGLMADRLGGYDIPFLACSGLSLIGALLFGALDRACAAERNRKAA